MDLLSNILATLRLRGNLYFRTELCAPWGIDVPADRQVARFHVVIRGACWLQVTDDNEALFLEEGDLAIVPHGSGHRIFDAPETTCRPLAKVLAEQPVSEEGLLRYGGAGAATALVCGYFSFDEGVLHPLLASLPRKLHVKGRDNLNFMWLDTALRFHQQRSGHRFARLARHCRTAVRDSVYSGHSPLRSPRAGTNWFSGRAERRADEPRSAGSSQPLRA